MQLLDGQAISGKILSDLKLKILNLKREINLDLILVGDDPASVKYVAMKQKKAELIGIKGHIHHLPATFNTGEIINLITKLNSDPQVTAFMVQLPLPDSVDTSLVLNSIDPAKDADGLTAVSLGRLFQNDPSALASATPLGIMELIKNYQIHLDGKNAVIIGRSPFIGLPLFALFQNQHATVTLCHSHTQNLSSICRRADILVTAVGKAKFITPDFVQDQAVVIDIGTNYLDGKLVGDVDFASVSPKCSFITPVPGGVGPMTIASLFLNTLKIYQNSPQS